MAANSSSRAVGVGRVLIAVYAILALAATGRSVFQIIDRFSEAPLAFSLSGLSALVYILATVALIMRGDAWYRVAWATIGFEFVGVIVVGTLSVFAPSVLGLHSVDPFGRQSTVWSAYGLGYLLIPLALPVLGMIFLYRRRPSVVPVTPVQTVGG
jgi:hypothetical protein